MDAAGLTKLLSPTGWALLSALPPYDERRTMALSERLRREGLDPELVAAALTQSRLRAKAHAKFGDFAEGMLFTAAGLEQATRLTVAAHHARRYTAAGITKVADLTCGVGADSMAFAGVGLQVLAVDLDEVSASVATVNLRHFPEAEVRHGDGLAVDLEAAGVDGVYADPARRTSSGSRVFDPAAYAPPLDAVLALRSRVPALGLKLGPGVPHSALPDDAEAQWVSVDGDVVELGLWFGPLAPDGPGRSALVLRPDGAHVLRSGVEGPPAPPVGPVGAYLYEPDGAVIRAGLVAEVAVAVQGRLVDRTIAYVTSDVLRPTPAATAYRVLDTLPFGLKRLRTYLRERDVGRLTIKKRGTAVVPEQLRAQLSLRGAAESTIILTRVDGRQQVLVVEPL
ncbi:class I SAM-dependent methyltransferase [Cellulomonas chengniuliangii]|uniref:Class I SAM-dependent methyltransferase n=1 Tax=Cellulomonas chengniuliangii TaxID=2968084 RepID=A0ABY5KYM7_9CELL|nr:class I SAM-dependent methyltransferase [Cellulomonas chengniuliangii]MCC2309682.1 class I SAM-dependent methyltransferase [Cellulomonas chengniuliangii]MCC2318978.1 class I SAM-dependent methyltransferase [Cellulomonas chengniuliangii]UUI74769.1 class I SAM-dependent methyltransferase [Cellulomonas chengniuliangii]